MPLASIVVPAFNAGDELRDTITSLLSQTYIDFEIIVVDDGSTDGTATLLREYFIDPDVRVVSQHNCGPSGALNSGIAAARGEFIGFCNAGDMWAHEKLAGHVAHLQQNSDVGISFSGLTLVDEAGRLLHASDNPGPYNITLGQIFKRNVIGKGSAPVVRRAVFDAIAFDDPSGAGRDLYFDETFRQCEYIECWLRIALTTHWRFEGIVGIMSHHRIHAGGHCAAPEQRLEAWDRMVRKLTPLAPAFFNAHAKSARAYLLRSLVRRAIWNKDPAQALDLLSQSLTQSWRPVWEEPLKTIELFGAAMLLRRTGPSALGRATEQPWGKR